MTASESGKSLESSNLWNDPSILRWAIYLGMSWTWVIGMYLPVLLVRDYGFWAWVIFAIPNCLGAAAMGWTIRSAQSSREWICQHAGAIRFFSFVTISFHLFVTMWLCPKLVGNVGWLVPAAIVQLAFTPWIRGKAQLTACAVVWSISLVVSLGLFVNQGLRVPPLKGQLAFDLPEVLGLSFVCLLGFLICPYFDLTFHTARQKTTDSGAKVAFGLGFCLFFATMILLTLFYASEIGSGEPSRVVAGLLTTHLAVQSGLTVALHARALRDVVPDSQTDRPEVWAGTGLALGAGFLAAMSGMLAEQTGLHYSGLDLDEILYRSYLVFYGLVFPAYAVVRSENPVRRWQVVGILTLVALPFYVQAFIHRQMAWAIVGVLIVVIGGVLTQALSGTARNQQS
ncbi:MAG: hypothetical protein KatS3mg104_3075 [Phycisphaerae bacterium]|jgi:hypothetical protein|nr:MAG: hypothetical protein KatS3mg104_3075 [Phycisphaerae bacterium]